MSQLGYQFVALAWYCIPRDVHCSRTRSLTACCPRQVSVITRVHHEAGHETTMGALREFLIYLLAMMIVR